LEPNIFAKFAESDFASVNPYRQKHIATQTTHRKPYPFDPSTQRSKPRLRSFLFDKNYLLPQSVPNLSHFWIPKVAALQNRHLKKGKATCQHVKRIRTTSAKTGSIFDIWVDTSTKKAKLRYPQYPSKEEKIQSQNIANRDLRNHFGSKHSQKATPEGE
jgi:hypothetical protein